MAPDPGGRLGQYEVVALLGAGGMGEVYRARDTKLGRDVAIKTLPELAAGDPERLARFDREAQLLAALNHPHIGAIYGIEDSPIGKFLVLELVDGESLADRLARDGRVPVGEALRIANQIIDALEAAHDKGIVHRDLKPGNIMLTADGQVKVLDFGLARAIESAPASVSNSPTLSIAATQAGMILGTAAYMSPEQAKGRIADKRSDVWAFGCVLYEMLTGKRAFEGEDVSDTLAAILRGEPDWNAFPNDVPQHVRLIIRRCLERDRKARIPDISVVRYLFAEGATTPIAAPTPASGRISRGRQVAIACAGLVAGIAVAAGAWWGARRWSPEPPLQAARFTVVLPAGQQLLYSPVDRTVALSPDSKFIVYNGRTASGDTALFLRRVDQLVPVTLLSGAVGARNPFFSADSQWVAFFTGGELKKIAVTGGPPMTLCRVSGGIRGATWTRSNQIIFATNDPTTGLMSVAAAGGEPQILTKVEAGEDHFQPTILPDDRTVLFTLYKSGSNDGSQIALFDLQTREQRILLRGGTSPEYVRSGHLVYGYGGTLRAVRFDARRREVIGDPVPVEQGVLTLPASGMVNYATSAEGHLVFTPGTDSGARRQLLWVHRDGREEPIKAEPRNYAYARLSPDGSRVALDVRDQEQDVWILDFARGIPTRLTFDPGLDAQPAWMPDGKRVVFQSGRTGSALNLFVQNADGTGTAERLTTNNHIQLPYAVLRSSPQLLFGQVNSNTGPDISVMRLGSAEAAQTLVATVFNELNADVSPDGRWLTYQSNDTGSPQIFVRPFPQADSGKWQISPAGGSRPVWSPSGRELFYLEPSGATVSVAVETSAGFRYGNPIKVFDKRYYNGLPSRSYDVSPDGKRFLVIKDPDQAENSATTGIIVVMNWAEELKAKLPAK